MADAASTGAAPAYRKSTLREYFESICVAVILALFVRTFVVQAFKIPTGSMENNLLIGDHLLVNKFVFAPTLTEVERTLLPGETIELRNKKVHVNGVPLEEPYVHFIFPPEDGPTGAPDLPDFDVTRSYGPVMVPDRQYFMMGDNRDNSQDSRYWGFMPEEYVKGKALFVYFSFGEARSGLAGLLGNVRWNRILHQIH
jgi:signal peptidase I